ncbi:hypothetical protein TWF970_011573 [Orbilia oligospora]|uniref:ER transporter 6TM N-terminal domain-containing protein n=1 Tax=Orbilia oligospora TaxID=2813651 RepID=A0A7C8VJU4_ORBOL|nr:hypothetical protein TWF970_011573 [Orbilia oligospora]
MFESNVNSSNDNSKANSKANANANANGDSSHPQNVGKGKSDDEHKESWMTLQIDKVKEWFKQLKADLKKDRLWQHILKCSIATECALIICLIPAVALEYGPAVFLGAIVSVFGHPGRNLGAMLETIVFALVGALVGSGWVTFASYVSDLIYRNNVENAHAFRAIILVISLLVHGYLRSKIPKIFVGVLLFLLTVIIQMTTPNFQFSAKVATTFLYPFLTGILICTFVNILVFPEFSSGKVAVVTVKGLELALETLKDATDFFVSPTDGVRKTLSKTEEKNGKAKDEDSDKDDDKEEEEGEQKEDPLKKLLSAREKLRKAVASSKATLKETSFEIGYSCLAPAKLHPISSKGLDALVTSTLTLIGACETKHIILGDDNEEKKKEEPAEEEEEKKDDDESDMDSIKEKLEVIRPKREAEVADEEFLKHLIERVDEPLTTIRTTLRQSITALIACIEFSCDVPITPENQSRKPKGILLKEIDIYTNATEVALVEFDKKTREALHKAAEKASEEEEVEFDILPREEIFLVSSFLLNFRIAAQTTLDMLKEGRDMVEEYDGLKGKKSFHLPDFKSKKWLFSGSAEQSETLDTNARENVSRYQKTAGAGNADQKAATQQKKDGSGTDSKKGSLKKTDKKTDKKAEGGKSKGGKGENPEAQKSERKGGKEEEGEEPESWPTRLRGALADVVDWVVTSPHLHYALKLAIGAMLLSWPAFVPEFSIFFYTYRGLWVIVIYILVFENSVGTSVQVFAYRTVGTIIGSLWGYAAWSAGRGNPYVVAVMLYFGFLVAFYIQLNTRYVKAGMVLIISMVVVSVGTSIDYIPGTVRGTALENCLKRAIAMIIGGSAAVIVQTVIFPVKARVKLVETIGLAVLKINEMESAIAFGVDQTTNIEDLANENAVKAFYKARKKADVSLAAASAYLTVSTQEPRIKGSFSTDKMIYKEIIYVLHQIIDRMENVLQLRLQLGSAVLENYYVYVYKYRRNVAAAITITLYAVHEALTSKLPLPQYFPSARLAQLRMVNRVRQILMESVSTNNNNENITEAQEAEDTAKRILRVEFMSYNASSAALEQVIEWLEELVDLTKLLRGAAEFRVGLLSRPTYREWVRQISIGGGGIDGAPPPSPLPPLSLSPAGEKQKPTKEEEPEQQKQQQQQQHGEGNHHRLTRIISSTRKQDVDTEDGEAGDGIPEPLKRVQSRHRENRAGVRRLSQSGGLPERVDALRRAARGL